MYERAVRGMTLRRLVVINPVANVLDAGGGEQVGGFLGLGQPGTEPAHWPFAGEALERVERFAYHCRLIRNLVDRHLLPGMAHEFPACVARRPRDALEFLAYAGV